MNITTDNIKRLIKEMGFLPEDGTNDIFYKKYVQHSNYILRVNFNSKKIEYRAGDVKVKEGIQWGDLTTSNFENTENFVVLECVNRLLEKGYAPKNLYLEFKFPLGRNEKGKLDILVFDKEGKAYLMIECKTWGVEFLKEQKKMQKDGGQLFSYYVQDKSTKYLCLYTSCLAKNSIEYKNDIIKANEAWTELNNQKEIHDHWNKNFKDNGIFEEWANAYDVEIKALVRGRLQPLTKADSGRIFNQFAEILRHNVVSDKPNAFNKILNLFICKIIDEDKNDNEQVDFQWLDNDTDESLQIRLNDLYKKGMHRFLDINVTDFSENEIADTLINIGNSEAQKVIREMFIKLRLQKNPEFAFIEVYDDSSFKLNARVVREVAELLQPYQFRYGHKQQFLGDFFELLLNTSIKQEAGQFFTPVPITRYIVSSLPIKEFIQEKLKTDDPDILPTVIDFACGTGHFLTEYMDKVQSIIQNEIDINKAKPSAKRKLSVWRDYDKLDWAREYVYGIDADYRLVKSSKVSSFLNGDGEANIIRANGLDSFTKSKEYRGKLKLVSTEDSKDNAQFDILIANPPYSVNSFKSTVRYGEESFELFKKLTDNSSEIECLFIERMKQLLKVGGYAGIILPSSILSNTGTYTAAREILLKYFKIIAITELGSSTFMATGTNTVTLFLERRPNSDYKHIQNAINNFFEKPKDVTVLGIEKAFSKYVNAIFDGITIEDYISFIINKPTILFTEHEIYQYYQKWFEQLTEVKKLKDSKAYMDQSITTQKEELNKLFYSKISAIEKEKLLYFLLTYTQKTIVTKIGEKQAEKEFLGYEFSNRRGHEGIKMLTSGTKLYDEDDPLNPEKANSYIYNAFKGEYLKIAESISDSIFVDNTYNFIDFTSVQFEKSINIKSKKKITLDSKYTACPLEQLVDFQSGLWKGEKGELTKVKVLRNTNFKLNNGKISYDDIAEIEVEATQLASRKLQYGDILLEKSGGSATQAIGRVVIFDKVDNNETYSFSNFCSRIRVTNSNVNAIYLWLMLNVFYNNGGTISLQNGIRLLNIDLPNYKKVKIPLPPIDIQEKIAYEIGLVEALENKNSEKIASLQVKLLLPEYFSFETERIENISVLAQRGKAAKYGTSNIQIIKSGQARGYKEFDFSRKHYVSDKFISDERNLQKGDVLINSTGVGTAGRVTLFDLDGEFVVDSHITIVRIDQTKALPKYVLYALANIGFKNIEAMANGQSGQIELALSTINAIRIPLPALETQIEIISQIETVERDINFLQAEIENVEEQKKTIFDKYLS